MGFCDYSLGTLWESGSGGRDARQTVLNEVPLRLIGLAVILAVSLTLAPLAVEAQQATKTSRIGILGATPMTPALFEVFKHARLLVSDAR